MHLLIADDDEAVRVLLERLLQRHRQCTVSHAANGIEAVARLDDQACDGVVLDLDMPLMGGIEVLQAIRTNPRHRALPVAMLTASRDAASVRDILALGVQGYIIKPLRAGPAVDKLLAFVDNLAPDLGEDDHDLRLTLAPDPRLLVADGDEDMTQFVTGLLAHRFDIEVATSGAHAVQLAVARRPDVILLGQRLDSLTAERTLDVLRRQPSLASLPVLALGDTGLAASQVLGQVPRTFVADRFLAAFDALVPRTGTTTMARQWRQPLIAATARVCDQQLGLQVAPAASPTRYDAGAPGVAIRLSGPGGDVDIGLRVPEGAATALANVLATRPGPAGGDGAHPLEPLLRAIGQQLATTLAERREAVSLGADLRPWDGTTTDDQQLIVLATDRVDLSLVLMIRDVSVPRAD
ncbi:response regulator [Luteitalea sp.]